MAYQYNKSTTLAMVRDRLCQQFSELLSDGGSESIHHIVNHVDRVIEKILLQIDGEINNDACNRCDESTITDVSVESDSNQSSDT